MLWKLKGVILPRPFDHDKRATIGGQVKCVCSLLTQPDHLPDQFRYFNFSFLFPSLRKSVEQIRYAMMFFIPCPLGYSTRWSRTQVVNRS